eukprot:g68948.t1
MGAKKGSGVDKNLSPCVVPSVASKQKRSRPNRRARNRKKQRLAAGVQTVGAVVDGGSVLRPIAGSDTLPLDPAPVAAATVATAGQGEVAVGAVVDGGSVLRPIAGSDTLPLDPVHAADTATTAGEAADGAVVGGGAETVPPDPVPDDDIPMSDYLLVSYSPRDGEPGSPLIMAFDEADPTRKGEAVQRCYPVDEVRNEIRSKRAKKNGYADREWKRFIDRVVAAGKSAYEQAQLSGTVDSYEPPIFQPQGAGSGFPEGDTDVPCPVKNSGEAACLRDAWLCALPRLQDSYVKSAHRELPGIACLDELVTLASYTDKQTGLLYRLVPRSLTFEHLARMRK